MIMYLVSTTDHEAVHYVVLAAVFPKRDKVTRIASLYTFLNMRDQVSQPCKTTSKIIVLYIVIFIFLDRKLGLSSFI
jgi:hypothetical protein